MKVNPSKLPPLFAALCFFFTLHPDSSFAWDAHARLNDLIFAASGIPLQQRLALEQYGDEPDLGMDSDLPETQDPAGDRKWMGGERGPTSKGFRHMYFGGWDWLHPLATIQYPLRPLGQAPHRVTITATTAKAEIRAGKIAEGWRHLAWALHYLQDLGQPFHSTQILHPKMLPFTTSHFVPETTRIISNYHYAYEAYLSSRLQNTDTSPAGMYLQGCLKRPGATPLPENFSAKNAGEFAAQQSRKLSWGLGTAVVQFFGAQVKEPGIDIPHGKGSPDYAKLIASPQLAKERTQLEGVTCEALTQVGDYSRALVKWALQP